MAHNKEYIDVQKEALQTVISQVFPLSANFGLLTSEQHLHIMRNFPRELPFTEQAILLYFLTDAITVNIVKDEMPLVHPKQKQSFKWGFNLSTLMTHISHRWKRIIQGFFKQRNALSSLTSLFKLLNYCSESVKTLPLIEVYMLESPMRLLSGAIEKLNNVPGSTNTKQFLRIKKELAFIKSSYHTSKSTYGYRAEQLVTKKSTKNLCFCVMCNGKKLNKAQETTACKANCERYKKFRSMGKDPDIGKLVPQEVEREILKATIIKENTRKNLSSTSHLKEKAIPIKLSIGSLKRSMTEPSTPIKLKGILKESSVSGTSNVFVYMIPKAKNKKYICEKSPL